MHGLFNRSLQSFLGDSFGASAWADIAQRSGVAQALGPDGFEAMQCYDDALTEAVLESAGRLLRRPRESLLEDLGTYLICNERTEPLRRLLRFGGVSFTDFLYSLDDLQGRGRLAVPELALPEFVLEEVGHGQFTLACRDAPPGFRAVMIGILRALADDYGALAVLDLREDEGMEPVIAIEVHDPAFHLGRHFDLGAGT